MRRFFVIWCRELTACFLSPVAYVTMVVFLVAAGGTFFFVVEENQGADESLTVMLFMSIVVWLPVLITVISMRLFTEERRSGTIETLMTAPVTETEVVLGKFSGALTFLVLICMPAVGNLFLLALLSPGVRLLDIDPGALSGGCLVLLLMAALWTAIGLFMSLLTQNQIIAAICSFCIITLALLFGFLLSALPMGLDGLGAYVSSLEHLETFSRGAVDARPIILYISGTCLMLFAATRVLEMKRWR